MVHHNAQICDAVVVKSEFSCGHVLPIEIAEDRIEVRINRGSLTQKPLLGLCIIVSQTLANRQKLTRAPT